MIITEDVQVKDRKSLRKVKQFIRAKRDHQRERVTRGSSLFLEKWDADRFSKMIGSKLIPKAVSKSLQGLAAKLILSEKSGEEDEQKSISTWKRVLLDTLEQLIPKVINRAMT